MRIIRFRTDRKAEVPDLYDSLRCKVNIAGTQATMHNPIPVGIVQPLGHMNHDGHLVFQRNLGLVVEQGPQTLACKPFRHNIEPALFFGYALNTGNVWVLDGSYGAARAVDRRLQRRVRGKTLRKDANRRGKRSNRILSLVHGAQRALSKLPENDVLPKSFKHVIVLPQMRLDIRPRGRGFPLRSVMHPGVHIGS